MVGKLGLGLVSVKEGLVGKLGAWMDVGELSLGVGRGVLGLWFRLGMWSLRWRVPYSGSGFGWWLGRWMYLWGGGW